MGSLDQTTAAAILKTLYYEQGVQDLSVSKSPFLAEIRKNEEFYGDGLKIPLAIADPVGRSATFTTAQTNANPSNYKAFTLTRVTDYAIGTITGEIWETAQNNKGTFINAVRTEIKKAMNALMRSAATKIHRKSTGTICATTAGTASPVTIARENAQMFEVGQVFGAVSDDTGTGSVRSGTGTITAINRSASATTATITFSGTITALAPGDFLFISGDYNAAMAGFESWVPSTAPGATAFFGVDRSVDTDRLGGLRHVVTGMTVEEGLLDALTFGSIAGAGIDRAYLNPVQYNALIKNLGSRAQYFTKDINARVGFKGVMVSGGTGDVQVIPDPFVPTGKGHLVTMDTWSLNSALKVPHILDYGGGEVLRQSTADAVEFRLGYRGNPATDAPGWNMIVTF